MTRIDMHSHLVPDAYRTELKRSGKDPGFPIPEATPEILSEVMDRFAIDAAVVSLSPPGVWFGDPGLARELARVVNEETASVVRDQPARFAGLATLPIPDVEGAIAEIAHALDELGLDGVAMFSNYEGTYLGDPALAPVFDELDRRGAYLFIHPIQPVTPSPMPDVPVWVQEFPFDTTRALTSLIYSGTLERCPNIRIQVAHLGGAATFLAHRLGEWAGREPERGEVAPAGAAAYLARLHYDTGLSNNAVGLASARQLTGIDRIVFGTDWPYLVLPETGGLSDGLDLDPGESEAVESANAVALVPRLVAALAD